MMWHITSAGLLGLAWLTTVGTPALADDIETPHLELVRALRAKGYHDLALEYLLRLKGQLPSVSKEIAARLPLEVAQSRTDVANLDRDLSKRRAQLQVAHAELEALLKSPGSVGKAEIHGELGRNLSEQGRTLALQVRQGANRAEAVRNAKSRFEAADKHYEQAVKLLDGYLQSVPTDNKNRTERQAALAAYLQALMQRGRMLAEYSQFPGLDDATSAQVGVQAAGVYEKAAALRDQHPLGWQALAHYAYIMEGINTTKANDAYKRVLDRKQPDALAAQALVEYFKMLGPWKAAQAGDKASRAKVRTECEKWLSKYANQLHGSEGIQVRTMLLRTTVAEISDLEDSRRKSPAGRQLIERAMKLADELEGELTEGGIDAEAIRFTVLKYSGRGDGPIAELRTFEDCLLRANIERLNAQEAAQKLEQAKTEEEKEALRKELSESNRNFLAACRRGQTLMPRDVKAKDWERLYLLLHLAYRRAGDLQRAVVVYDFLASSAKRTDLALSAAVEALTLYQFLGRQGDTQAQRRMTTLAHWIEKTFPDEPQTDMAREVLGMAAFSQRQYQEAMATLERVSPRHARYGTARYYAGVAAWTLHVAQAKEKNTSPKTPSPSRDRAVRLMRDGLKALQESKDDAEVHLLPRAQINLAEILQFLGNTDETLALLMPLVDRIEKKAFPTDLQSVEPQVLSMALRGMVQKRDLQGGAMRVLRILRQRGGEGGTAQVNDLLRDMGRQLRGQLAELEQRGPEAANTLKSTRESFKQFLVQLEADPPLPPDLRLWVASSYASMGEHAKAASLYAGVPRPPPNADEAATLAYRQSRLQRVVALRSAAVLAPEPQRAKLLTEAETALTEAMAEAWAKKHPMFLKEQILLVQLRGVVSGPQGAIAQWDKFRRALEPHLDKSRQIKEAYYEANFHLMESLVIEARQLSGPERRAGINRAAQLYVLFKRDDFGGPEHKVRFEQFLNADAQAQDFRPAVEQLLKAS